MPTKTKSQTNKSRGTGKVRVYLGLLISLVCITWVIRSVDLAEIGKTLRGADPFYVSLAVLATFLSYVLRAFRWPFFFDNPKPDFLSSFRCLIVGFFMNNVLPARIGEFVRAHLGRKVTKKSGTVVLATIAGERLADGLMISVLFATLFSLETMQHPTNKGAALYYVALFFALAAVACLILISQRERIFVLLERLGKIMPGHLSGYTLTRLRRFIDGLAPMFRLERAMVISFNSLVIWSVELSVYYFITQAFHHPLRIGDLSLFLAAVNFSSLIPAAPAGAGVIELVTTQALEEINVPTVTALSMVATQHVIQFLVVGLPGLYFFFYGLGGKIPEEESGELGDDESESARFTDVSEPRPTPRKAADSEAVLVSGADVFRVQEEAVDISVVIPAYNEELRLPKTLLAAYEYFQSRGVSYEILVVDDGSQDETAKVVTQFEHLTPHIRLLSYPKNRGKGYAVRFGMFNSRGRIVLFDDADGATPIEEIERLEAALSSGAHVAIGSRALHSAETGVTTLWYRKLLGRVFNALVNVIVLPGIADTQCGFKLFTRKAAKFIFSRQRAERFSFDVELLFLARKAGFRIAEVPVNWTNVPGSKVNLAKDSLAMLRDILRFRMRDLAGGYGKVDQTQLEAESAVH